MFAVIFCEKIEQTAERHRCQPAKYAGNNQYPDLIEHERYGHFGRQFEKRSRATAQRARQQRGNERSGKNAGHHREKHGRRDFAVHFFQCEYHSRKGCARGDGKSRRRAARHGIFGKIPSGKRQFGNALAERRTDQDGRTFRTERKPREKGKKRIEHRADRRAEPTERQHPPHGANAARYSAAARFRRIRLQKKFRRGEHGKPQKQERNKQRMRMYVCVNFSRTRRQKVRRPFEKKYSRADDDADRRAAGNTGQKGVFQIVDMMLLHTFSQVPPRNRAILIRKERFRTIPLQYKLPKVYHFRKNL